MRSSSVTRFCGGKGANQAVAAARLGAEVQFFGKVGKDAFGERLLAGFAEHGVDVSVVERSPEQPTGTAMIWVDERGENAIVVAAGANGEVGPEYVDRHLDALRRADVLLLQFEIPTETVAHVLRTLPAGRPKVLLDPAPAASLDGMEGSRLAAITPNEEELLAMSGERDLEVAARKLLDLGVEIVVATLGPRGARVFPRDETPQRIPGFAVDAVDTTASGDAFAAAFAVGLASSDPIDISSIVRRACAVGALTCTTPGAWPSLPTNAAVDSFLAQ